MALHSSLSAFVSIVGDGVSTQVVVNVTNDPIFEVGSNSNRFLWTGLSNPVSVQVVSAINNASVISVAVAATWHAPNITFVFAVPPDAYNPVIDNVYNVTFRLLF